MTWDTATKLLVPLLGFFGVWLQVRRSRHGIDGRIKERLELLALLPDASEAREPLRQHIDDAIKKMIKDESVLRRDATGIVLSLIFGVIGVFLTAVAIESGGWWWWLLPLAVIFFIFGAVGLNQDGVRRERDEGGRPIE